MLGYSPSKYWRVNVAPDLDVGKKLFLSKREGLDDDEWEHIVVEENGDNEEDRR